MSEGCIGTVEAMEGESVVCDPCEPPPSRRDFIWVPDPPHVMGPEVGKRYEITYNEGDPPAVIGAQEMP